MSITNNLWTAIEISLTNFVPYFLVPHFKDRDINKPNPKFKEFKRISNLDMSIILPEDWVLCLQMISKQSIFTEKLRITNENLKELFNSHKEQLMNLKTNKLELFQTNVFGIMYKNDISSETVEALNLISSKCLKLNKLDWSYDNLNNIIKLNSTHLETIKECR